MLLASFSTRRNHKKTSGFQMFSGGYREASGMKWVDMIVVIGKYFENRNSFTLNFKAVLPEMLWSCYRGTLYPLHTGRKLNLHMTFRRRPGRP